MLVTQFFFKLESNMEIRSSDRSRSMMPSSVWEASPLCSMTVVNLMLSTVLPSEDTPSPSSAEQLKKPPEVKSPCPKSCSICSWPVDTLPIRNSRRSPRNGDKEDSWLMPKRISFFLCQLTSTQWPCSQWPSFTCKEKASSSRLIKVELTRLNIGKLIMKIQWILLQNCLRSALSFIDTNINILSWSIPTLNSTGLETLPICLVMKATEWWSAWEVTSPFTLITKEAMFQLIPATWLDLLLLILICLTQLPWMVWLVPFTDSLTKNAWNGWLSSRSSTREKDPTEKKSKSSLTRLLAKAELSPVTVTLSWETPILDSCTWRDSLISTSRTITLLIWPENASTPFPEFWVKSEKSKTHSPTSMPSVESACNTMVHLVLFRFGWEWVLHSCVRCFKSPRCPHQRHLGQSLWLAHWET